jgi:hypothetical protein
MKQPPNNRRGRSRNSGKRNSSSRGGSVESKGPEAKVRGSSQQVMKKYLALAQDALLGGDRIAYENYLQHAEHYLRVSQPEQGAREKEAGNNANQAKGQNAEKSDKDGNIISVEPVAQDTAQEPPQAQPTEEAPKKTAKVTKEVDEEEAIPEERVSEIA